MDGISNLNVSQKKLKNWLCFVFVILRTSVAASSCLVQLYGRIGSLGCYVSLLPSVFIKDLFDLTLNWDRIFLLGWVVDNVRLFVCCCAFCLFI